MCNFLCVIFEVYLVAGVFLLCWLGAVKIRRLDEVEDSSIYSGTELSGFDEHKTVILHLLSQLKLGMDLTKVSQLCFFVVYLFRQYFNAVCFDHSDAAAVWKVVPWEPGLTENNSPFTVTQIWVEVLVRVTCMNEKLRAIDQHWYSLCLCHYNQSCLHCPHCITFYELN